jgi:hypothetical protein
MSIKISLKEFPGEPAERWDWVFADPDGTSV